ncbi:YibE/F family protein [Nocardioides terrisoli]|uniref:YibE/F family protein n=1 Tax=Nocardioides terrisoli TaxID=3388267 RepID=UPI00287BBADB|nr:YibE/F family protein [Nocardioides marmorisolisilvae]
MPLGTRSRWLLLTFLAGCAIAALVGMVVLFPHSGAAEQPHLAYSAPGTTYPEATVIQVQHSCPGNHQTSTGGCAQIRVRVSEGVARGESVTVQLSAADASSGLRAGDRVELIRTPGSNGAADSFAFFGVVRHNAMWALGVLFLLVVVAVARLRGLLAVVSLSVGGAVVLEFMLPALLQGHSGVGVALSGSTVIMFVVLYLTHGISLRTSTALAGTLLGIGLTTVIGWYAVRGGRLSGVGDDASGLLSGQVHLNFQGLFMCMTIVAALGVLNDVTITQVSAVWELRAAAPEASLRSLFSAGMRIGRDHLASTIYTLVFAYVGTAMATLLLVQLYAMPASSVLNSEDIAEEVLRTLTSSIGLVLTVPFTTALAALLAGTARAPRASRNQLVA